MTRNTLIICLGISGLIAATRPAAAEAPSGPTEALVIGQVSEGGRRPFPADAIVAEIVNGSFSKPKEGDTVVLPNSGTSRWEKVPVGENGVIEHGALNDGYALVIVKSDEDQILLLDAKWHRMVYVNGAPRGGDVYGTGTVRLPIKLHRGDNQLLFACIRGRMEFSLHQPEAPIIVDLRDKTIPDLLPGETVDAWIGVMVINASERALNGLQARTTLGSHAVVTTPLPIIQPLSIRKVPLRIQGGVPMTNGDDHDAKIAVALEIANQEWAMFPERSLELPIRRPGETYRRTFVSGVDGSVQYYAVRPAKPGPNEGCKPALFLSLHGASVEAINQANSYSRKSWGHVVAPTNRRKFGFDWEDWGRLDALEVLDIAQRALDTDPRRVYLTGHSMGGHGTWSLGSLFPDRFAAIGPSAGWISFRSYSGAESFAEDQSVAAVFERAAAICDTLGREHNLGPQGIYILHGDADDNVPVSEARTMAERLGAFHHDWQIHEEPGKGHWWDGDPENGAACVDWPPMFDLFARRTLPSRDEVRYVDFTTVSPGVSAEYHWARVESQLAALKPSRIQLRWDPGRQWFTGTTENVRCLSLDTTMADTSKSLTIRLDEQEPMSFPSSEGEEAEANDATPSRESFGLKEPSPRETPAAEHPVPMSIPPRLYLLRDEDGTWSFTHEPSKQHKGPHRAGPFKETFNHRVCFVFGTRGTPEENAWSFNKARFDAEVFLYRGNASIDVIADTEFSPARFADRSVILYGNPYTNFAAIFFLADSPVRVTAGSVKIGDRLILGENLACLMVRPRPDSDSAMVALIGGTGLPGMRLADRVPYFVSGIHYPDVTLFNEAVLQSGLEGVLAAGFFENDWTINANSIAFAPSQ